MARTKGTKDIPKRKKAQILAEKNLGLSSQADIAKKHGVHFTTVSKITEESVPPAVLEMSKRYLAQYRIYAEANAMKAQIQAFDTMHELNAKDATAVAEKNFNMIQALDNAATTNYSQMSDEELAKGIYKSLLAKGHAAERIIEKLEQEFPAVDVKKLGEGE